MALSKVLVIYTGGTIGSRPKDPDPDSPQVVVPWEELEKATPELQRLKDAGVQVDCVSSEPPLDSCNIGPKEWVWMAKTISQHYDAYEGFAVLHGTDTMVYTASVLSFMLRNLAKPVILTGAQRSAMVDIRNDATQNFITALHLACPSYSKAPLVPEVCIYFGGKLLRGNRSVKRDTAGYEAYESPNLPPLGEIGDRIDIDRKLLRPMPEASRRFLVQTRLSTDVTTVFIYPGIQDVDLVKKQLLDNDKLKGAIILSYGSGNIPTLNPDFLDVFSRAHDKGIVLVNVSQCRRGPVELGIYETSAELLERGFVAASDITLEAALCKLQVLLGDEDLDKEGVESFFQQDMAGEQSRSVFITKLPAAKVNQISTMDVPSANVRIPGRPVEGKWEPSRLERALLRFHCASVERYRSSGPAFVRLFANLDNPEEASESHPGYAGRARKEATSKPGIIIFDVTRAVAAIARPGDRISFTLFLDTPGTTFSWREVELALIGREVAG